MYDRAMSLLDSREKDKAKGKARLLAPPSTSPTSRAA